MDNYIKLEEEHDGTKVDKIFITDVMEVSLFTMNIVEQLKETDENPSFNVGIGGSIIGDQCATFWGRVTDKDTSG